MSRRQLGTCGPNHFILRRCKKNHGVLECDRYSCHRTIPGPLFMLFIRPRANTCCPQMSQIRIVPRVCLKLPTILTVRIAAPGWSFGHINCNVASLERIHQTDCLDATKICCVLHILLIFSNWYNCCCFQFVLLLFL